MLIKGGTGEGSRRASKKDIMLVRGGNENLFSGGKEKKKKNKKTNTQGGVSLARNLLDFVDRKKTCSEGAVAD